MSLHAWNPKFFNLLASTFGTIVKIDDEKLNKTVLQRARILMRTTSPEIHRGPFIVTIDGRQYSIRIHKEDESMVDDTIEYESGSEDVCDSEEDDIPWMQPEDVSHSPMNQIVRNATRK